MLKIHIAEKGSLIWGEVFLFNIFDPFKMEKWDSCPLVHKPPTLPMEKIAPTSHSRPSNQKKFLTWQPWPCHGGKGQDILKHFIIILKFMSKILFVSFPLFKARRKTSQTQRISTPGCKQLGLEEISKTERSFRCLPGYADSDHILLVRESWSRASLTSNMQKKNLKKPPFSNVLYPWCHLAKFASCS